MGGSTEPTQVVYTFENGIVSPQRLKTLIDDGDATCQQVENSYVVFWEAQSISGRQLNDIRYPQLQQQCEGIRGLVSTRWDLFYTTEGPAVPGDLLENYSLPFDGPYWDYMTGGTTPIPTPPASILQSIGLSQKEAEIEALGYTILNKDTQPHGYGLPYTPRVNHATKEVWYNNQQVRVGNSDWQDAVTDYVSEYENHVAAEGVLFQFVKPQHYGNKTGVTTCDNLESGNFQNAVSSARFDHVAETPYEWFISLSDMYWKMLSKKNGIMVLDLAYFGIPVWRYARQIVDEWALQNGISIVQAASEFYDAIETMGNAADFVIQGNKNSIASSDPVYAVPPSLGSTFNLINTVIL